MAFPTLLSRKTQALGRRSIPTPFSYLPPPPLNGGEKLLVLLEVVGQIVYLLILIVILVFALRKRKYPNSSGGHEAPVRLRVSGTGNDDVGVTTTTSSQLPLDPTYVVLNMVTDLS